MRRLLLTLTMCFGFSGGTSAQFADHPLFSRSVGTWAEDSQTEDVATGSRIFHTGQWTAQVKDGGKRFEIEGYSIISGQRMDYTWTYTYDTTNDTFEACQTVSVLPGNEFHYSGKYDRRDGILTMTSVAKDLPLTQVLKAHFEDDIFKIEMTRIDHAGRPVVRGSTRARRVARPKVIRQEPNARNPALTNDNDP